MTSSVTYKKLRTTNINQTLTKMEKILTGPHKLPKMAARTTLDPELQHFLATTLEGSLRLGGPDYIHERRHHTEVLGIHALEPSKQAPIHRVEFTAIRGPYGSIPIRVLYPSSATERQHSNDAAALIYFHGGGYTVGTVDEFENGLRIVAEGAGVIVFAVEYRLAPEWSFPVQLDEYAFVIDWLLGSGCKERGINPRRICVGGDSAGGNMSAAISLKRRDEGKKDIKAQILLYPEARVPFDTPAAVENNSTLYLQC